MKAVLLSSIPLPYNKIGSWNKRYTELILSKENPFNYIICPAVDENMQQSTSKYLIADRYKKEVLYKFFYKYSYYFFLKQLLKIIRIEKKLVIHIVDNVKLLNEVDEYLTKKKLRSQCKIIFNSCGFSYFFPSHEGTKFYNKIDHFICSTYESYKFELERYSYLSAKVTIIPNGIDSSKFFKILPEEKNNFKVKLGYENKKIILWVSQERKKKGLHIFLEAWFMSKMAYDENFVLVIIGTSKACKENNVHYLGRMANENLSAYYQCSDYYFFTTLVHEGFGLSLGEAIKSGSTCFVSNIAPMNEVIQGGSLGYLVDNPNIAESWKEALDQIFENKINKIDLPKSDLDKLYSLNKWCESMVSLISYEKR